MQDHALYNQQLIAVPTFNQKPTYYSLVLTDNDRTEKTLADFKGDVLAFSDIKKLTDALVNMKNNDQGKMILKNFVLDGFVEKPHAFYNPITLIFEDVDIDNTN